MPVPSTAADLSTTAASNYPQGADAIGTSHDDYMRAGFAIIKQQDSKGSDIASATTIDVPASGKYFVVTGTTTIAGISDDWNGRSVILKFSGVLQLTHSASLILPTSANITTAAGDCLMAVNESTGVWRVVVYQRASGASLVSGLVSADIGVTVQAYDADTTKNDVANTFTAQQSFTGTTAAAPAIAGAADPNTGVFFPAADTVGVSTGGTEAFRVDSSGNLTLSRAALIGFGTGAGGTVTQATSKSTSVTLNKPCGQITMNNASLAGGASVEFTFNNSFLDTSSVFILNVTGFSGYRCEVRNIGSGSGVIRLVNVTGGALAEAVQINFVVIKGVTA